MSISRYSPPFRHLLRQHKLSREHARNTVYVGPTAMLLRNAPEQFVRNPDWPRPVERLRGHCYHHATSRARRDKQLRYCEGYCLDYSNFDPDCPFNSGAMPHAWLLGPDGQIIDETWRGDCGQGTYLGITIPTSAVLELVDTFGYYGSFVLATNRTWPRVEKILARYMELKPVRHRQQHLVATA